MKSKKLSKLLLLVLGSLVGLLALEIVVRLLGLAPQLAAIEVDQPYASFVSSPNPDLKYVPKPNSGDINADGFRDRSYPKQKGEGTFRIAVLGDSIAFGYCNESRVTRPEDTFAGLLEQRLNEERFGDFERTEVLNFAVSGYDTLQEVAFLEHKGLAYEPDLVLVAYCLNDLQLASRELFLFGKQPGWESYRKTADLLYRSLIFRSHLARFIWQRAPYLSSRFGGEEQVTPDDPMERTAAGFARLEQLGQQFGFEALVVIFPAFRDFDDYPFLSQHWAVEAQAKAHGLGTFDLLPVYREAAGSADLCSPCCDLHPNETGHRVTADAIAERLRESAAEKGTGASF